MKLSRWKPLKGWRAFAGEIGVVTLGVLIALLAQQVAAEIDWRNRANGASEALRRELGGHYLNSLERRLIEPCVAAQLDALERRLLASGDRLRPAPTFREDEWHYTMRVPTRDFNSAAWQGALAEGVSSHLAPAQRAILAEQYDSATLMTTLDHQLDRTASRLAVLAKPLPLDAAARLTLLTDIEEARYANALLGEVAGQHIDRIVRLRMTPSLSERRAWLASSGTVRFCREHRLPLRSYVEAQLPPRQP